MDKIKSYALPLAAGIVAVAGLVGLYFLVSNLIAQRDVVGMTLFVGSVMVAAFWVGTRVLFGILKILERKVEALEHHLSFLETQIKAGFDYQRDLDTARVRNKIAGPRPSLDQIIEAKEKWDNYTDSAESSAQEKTQ